MQHSKHYLDIYQYVFNMPATTIPDLVADFPYLIHPEVCSIVKELVDLLLLEWSDLWDAKDAFTHLICFSSSGILSKEEALTRFTRLTGISQRGSTFNNFSGSSHIVKQIVWGNMGSVLDLLES